MNPPRFAVRLRILYILLLTLPAMAPEKLLAIQIAPNPNPSGNTITITPSAPGENLVPYSNGGLINIEAQASFQNSSQFNNGSLDPHTLGGAVVSSGTIINSDQFINNRFLSILEGGRFINLASGFYWNLDGITHIAGTFINKGAVEHNSYGFTIFDTGQYIQRQDSNSSVAPITVNRDQVFRNAGLVHIVAGEFSNRPFGIYSQTGTTQVDGVFQNSGRVFNGGQVTVGTTGLYEHNNAFRGPPSNEGGRTFNFGTFANAGTSNIATGVFQNQGSVANSGTFSVGTAGQYSQTSSSASIAPTTVNTGNFGNRGTTNIDAGNFENGRIFSNTGMTRIGESATFRNTDTGLYNQPPGTTTKIDGSFINKFAMQSGGAITVSPTGSYSQVAGTSFGTGTANGGTFTNAGQVYIGQSTSFGSFVVSGRPSPSGQYVQQASGTTRIDGVFDNRGSVKNEGAITVGATGQYLQSRGDTTALTGASTTNTGTFTSAGQVRIGEGTGFSNGTFIDAGTTNINAGVFENNGDFRNNKGQVNIGQGGLFSNTHSTPSGVGTVSALYLQEVGGRTRIDGGFDNRGSVSNEGTIAVGATGTYTGGGTRNAGLFQNEGRVSLSGASSSFFNTGQYAQLTSGKTEIGGMFVNLGGKMSNAGAITVGATGQYVQESFPGLPPGVSPGTTTNSGSFSNAGTTNINTGVFENSRIFGNTGIVRIGEEATFANTSSGIYHPLPGGTTKIDGNFINNFAVQNGGAITVSTTGSYSQVVGTSFGTGTGNGGTFTNAGWVHIGEGTTFSSFLIPDRPDPSGQYVQQASGATRIDGVFDNRGSVKNEGAITVGTTGQFLQSRGDTTVLTGASTINSGTFTNAGQVRIGEGTSFSNFPRLENGASAAVGGQYIQQVGGTTQIDGSFSNQGGRVTNEYKIYVGATGTFNQTRSSAPVPGTPTTVNIGAFTNAGNTLINAGTFTNQGSLVNSGTFQIGANGAGTLTNQGIVVNTGTFQVAALGQVSGAGSYLQNAAAAQTIVNGTFAHPISLQAGSLSGTGIITGAVMNTGGVVQPGSSIVPGTLTLANYTQGIYGRLDLKIGGLLAGSHYDVLKVTGPATFAGSLSVRLINGFTPGLGNTFNLLACSLGCSGLNSGTLFSGGLALPSLSSGLAWLSGLTEGGNGFSLTVVAAATSAPEPGTLLLIASGFVGLVMWRRRQSRSAHASHE